MMSFCDVMNSHDVMTSHHSFVSWFKSEKRSIESANNYMFIEHALDMTQADVHVKFFSSERMLKDAQTRRFYYINRWRGK